MNVKEMVAKALKDGGYDGLYNRYLPCGCPLNDLMICGVEGIDECEAAYRMTFEQAKAAGLDPDPDSPTQMVAASEWEKCWECGGKGYFPATASIIGPLYKCPHCHGVGLVRIKKLSADDARCAADKAEHAADKAGA